jgi:hypothetical protein
LTDEGRYPRSPLFGVQSDWSKQRPITIEQFVEAMDAAGVDKAAIVQASTCYGYDIATWPAGRRVPLRRVLGGVAIAGIAKRTTIRYG